MNPIVEISTPDEESYWEATDEQLKAIIKLTPAKAASYIKKNCLMASIHNSNDVDFGFATNCEDWEWKEFIDEVEEHLEG